MVQHIVYNKVKHKQATYSYAELILETFTGHQEPKESIDNYCKSFKFCMETVKVHGKKP